VGGRMASSQIITVGYWLRGSYSLRWNDCLAVLIIMAAGQNGWSWHVVDFCHQFRRYPQLRFSPKLVSECDRISGWIPPGVYP
jgi:hypothetical protein